jgi:hypothetical protein
MERVELWPRGIKIPVIGVTGAFGSGKTLFLATIDPTNTLIYDTEKSSASYEPLGFKRVDLADEVQRLHPNGATAQQSFESWLAMVRKVPAGKYSMIAVDPIDDLENGLIDHVMNNSSRYGFASRESFEKAGGIKWAAIKNTWKMVLQDVAARCETFGFSTHLRRVWSGGMPTDEVQPRGKSTLMELASLYLLMEREPGRIPSAIPLKSRLAIPVMTDAGLVIKEVLPPRMPVGTPQGLRDYIVTPVDMANLRDEEKSPERSSGSRDAGSAVEEARRKVAERAAGGPPVTEDEAVAMEAAAQGKGIDESALAGVRKILASRGVNHEERDATIKALAQLLNRAEYSTLLEKIEKYQPKKKEVA